MTLDELDRLAAEKVMGWELRLPSRVWIIRRENSMPAIDTGKQHNKGPHQNRWQPTRNIAQAWECLDALDTGHLKPEWSMFSPGEGRLFVCSIRSGFELRETHEGEADTLPLAIVKACLKAKGVEL